MGAPWRVSSIEAGHSRCSATAVALFDVSAVRAAIEIEDVENILSKRFCLYDFVCHLIANSARLGVKRRHGLANFLRGEVSRGRVERWGFF